MFHPSHFRKAAKELGMDPVSYEREYNYFLAKLKKFHESKGSPFRRLPWLGGQFLDLYLLYKKVTSFGGWIKVTEDKKWIDVAEVFSLPSSCTNAAFAIRQHYARYLETFERINFFGEDAEDVMTGNRPHTPVTALPISSPSEYVSPSHVDVTRNFEKLVLSLQCGLPNEVDFGINICMLLSNVNNSVFNLTKAPAIIDMLMGHVGIFLDGPHGLGEVYSDWYQKTERDYTKFWRETLEIEEFRDLLCNGEGKPMVENDDIELFNPGRKYGINSVEAQRVSQVCLIFYNFSFDDTNADILASHPLCLRFLMLCVCNQIGNIQNLAWNTISNLAEKMKMEPVECKNTQMVFQILHYFLENKDRFKVVKAMDVLGKLCSREDNNEVVERAIEMQAYESLVRILIIPDVQLVIGSLEALYNISSVGTTTSDQIASVDRSIDILVCLVTLDAESFGAQALSEVVIIENRILSTSMPMPPRPRPAMHSPTAPPVSPHSPSVSSSRNEVDSEVFTVKWLQATYEALPSGTVSRIDLYADYLSSCSRLARIGILNASAFNRIVKFVFPDVQLRRYQSGTQLQYALFGMRRRANPLPVASSLDQQATSSNPGQPRTPTPPVPGRHSPNWNQTMPQRSMSRHAPPSGVFSQGNIIQKTPNQMHKTPLPGTPNDNTRLPGQFTPNQVQRPSQQQWQQQKYQQPIINQGRPQQMSQKVPGQVSNMVPQGAQQLIRPQPQQPMRMPNTPTMATRSSSPGQPRIAPRQPVMSQPGLVPIRPAPPNIPMQSPAPVSSQPGPGPNSRLHNGSSPAGALRASQLRSQRQVAQFSKGAQRVQTPQAITGQAKVTQGQMVTGQGGYRGGQPIAIAPKPTSNASLNITGNPTRQRSSDGVVLIAREEKAEDILTSDLIQNAEEQKIVVVENTNNAQKNTAVRTTQENGSSSDNDIIATTERRDYKKRHANLNSEGLVDSNQIDQNGINNCKRTRMENDNSPKSEIESNLDETMVNGDIRIDPRNKLMDKLLGKDLHMPLNGICDINSPDLDLINPANEQLSSSNSKTSSPDIFDSENNSDFGKYLEESDTDTGLFSDVILGDLRIDSVDGDPKTKNNDSSKSIPSLPDLGYHAVAQELRNPGSFPIKTNTESLQRKSDIPNNMHDKAPITTSMQTNQSTDLSDSTKWNGSASLPGQPNSTSTAQTVPKPQAQQNLNAILEHRTRALVAPKMISTEQNNRHQFAPQVMATQPIQGQTVAQTAQAIPGNHSTQPVPGNHGNQPVPGNHGNQPVPGNHGNQPIPGSQAFPGTGTQPIPGQQASQGIPTQQFSVTASQSVPGQPVNANQAGQPGEQQLVANTPTAPLKPYQCKWDGCTSSFDGSKQLFSHVISAHVPCDTLVMSCLWENCAPVRRSRSSLLFHLQQKHSGPTPVTNGIPNPQTQAPPPPQIAQSSVNQQNQANYFPAYKLLSRMMSALQDEEESPLTKTVRLTSALVLRNIAQYSSIARGHLRRHERLLSEFAMSRSEAAHAIAACLSELSPHRKKTEQNQNTFIWTFNR